MLLPLLACFPPKVSAVLFNELFANVQPQTSVFPRLFSGKKGLENSIHVLWVNARSIVLNGHPDKPLLCPCLQRKHTSAVLHEHSLFCVGYHLEQNLAQFAIIGHDLWQILWNLLYYLDIVQAQIVGL